MKKRKVSIRVLLGKLGSITRMEFNRLTKGWKPERMALLLLSANDIQRPSLESFMSFGFSLP